MASPADPVRPTADRPWPPLLRFAVAVWGPDGHEPAEPVRTWLTWGATAVILRGLEVHGRIEIADDRLVVVDAGRSDDDLADAVLDVALAGRRQVEAVLRAAPHELPGLLDRLGSALAETGAARAVRRGPTRRRTGWAVDRDVHAEVVGELRALVATPPSTPSEPAAVAADHVVAAALAESGRVSAVVHPDAPQAERVSWLRAATVGWPTGRLLRRMVQDDARRSGYER